MLAHLVHGRLPHIDIGQFGSLCVREPLVSDVRADQHDPVSFRTFRGSLAFAASARRSVERSVSASWSADSATGAECRPWDDRADLPTLAGVDTQHDLEAVGGSSRITFSLRRFRLA